MSLGNPSGQFWQAAGSHDSLLTGSVTATTSPAALPAQATVQVLVQNDPDNVENILVGNSVAQLVKLRPGEWILLNVLNLQVIYYKSAASTATVNYLAR